MRSCVARSLLCVALCLHAAPVLSQLKGPGATGATPSSDDGHVGLKRSLTLRLHGVWDMHQDRQGFMWFGTAAGLYRYDGYDLKAFRHSPFHQTSLSSNRIRGFYEDHDGSLWVGTMNGGLNRLDPGMDTFTRFRHDPNDENSLSDGEVRAIGEDHEGKLWIGTRDGLCRLDRERGIFTRFRHDPGDAATHIETVFLDRSGVFWIGTENGLLRLNPDDTFTRYLYHSESGRSGAAHAIAVTSMIEDAGSSGTLWLGTDHGLLRFDSGTGLYRRFVPDSTIEDIRVIQDLIPDPQSPAVLWVATAGSGVVRFDTRTERFSPFLHFGDDPNSLSSNSPLSLYADRFGSFWVSSLNAVDQFVAAPGNRVAYYSVSGAPKDSDATMVSSIYEDQSGALWIGEFRGDISKVGGLDFSGGSLSRIDRASGRVERWRHIADDPTSMSDGIVTSILEDHAGRLWVGIWGGGLNLMDRETGRFTRFTHDAADMTSLSGDRVVTLFEDRGGTLWIGTNKRDDHDAGGLSRMETTTGRFTRFVPRDDDSTSLSGPTVLAITEDAAGRLWVGTDNGLNLMDRARGFFKSYRHSADDPNSLLDDYILALYADSTGLWIGTPSGLDRFDYGSGTFSHFTERDGLVGGGVMGIVPDNDENLWITTRDGLSRFDPRTTSFRNYEDDSDLAATQYLLGAHFRSDRGELFFPSPKGVLSFFPRRLRANAVAPSVVLEDVRLSHNSVPPESSALAPWRHGAAKELHLAHDQNSIAFEYVALHFINPARNEYAYRLEGFDADWVQAGTQRIARYTNLDAGTYDFHVKAANSDGVWNEEGASIRLVIAPPWWHTGWAYALYGVLLIGGVLAAGRLQRHRILRRERDQAQKHEAAIRADALNSEIRHKELALERARELERVNARLRAHEEQLKAQAERLQAIDEMKSRFFANLSHEFRTPLTLILGPIDDVLRDGGTIDHRTLEGMRRSARRLLRLIDQLLALARLEFGSMTLRARRIDLVASIRSIVLAFAARAEREGITLSFVSTEDHLDGDLDPDKLETIMTNLLSNAFKYTTRGGKIGVSVGIDAGKDGPQANIVVRDTGEGIPPGELPYVFNRFYQGSGHAVRRRDGLGLGLALSKELVELHGGVMRVESQVGFGSTFIVLLPTRGEHLRTEDVVEEASTDAGAMRSLSPGVDVLPEEEAAENEEVVPDGAADAVADLTDAKRVLVVEDNPDLRAHLRSRLEGSYAVIEACDGVEGLALVRQHKPALVIADVMMPNMDGLAMCRTIKEDPALNHIPVVLLTARAAEEDLIEGLQTGADDYLTKPFSTEELLLRVENLIEVRRHLRERFSDEVVIQPGRAVVSSEIAAFMERVRQVIEERMSDSGFGVAQLADELNMSTRQLQRRMKEDAALSASSCIRMMRLERAAQLLEQDAGRVSEIASAVGFSDPKYFSRRFRQVFGVLPSEFGSQTRQEG